MAARPPRSPLAPEGFPEIPPVAGVRLATTNTGLRYRDRPDLLMAVLPAGSTAAGVFTRSSTAAAPVLWCRQALESGAAPRMLVVNAGNANAFTGRAGDATVAATAAAAAALEGCDPSAVYLASTGVIGVPLDPEGMRRAVADVHGRLGNGGWLDAAGAIMTTDTFEKAAVREARIGGVTVTLAGIAKGSGMIQPDMATMLAFVFTDARLPAPVLQTMLRRGADRSFNSITVDSDTSTSDTLMLFATGAADHPSVDEAGGGILRGFRAALEDLLVDLAQQVVRDGEGASKFVTVTVTGAASTRAARRIALAIANSPLVKTAIAGEDANWGRVVMAVGKSGERANRDRLAIDMGGIAVAREGERVTDYDETPLAAHLKGREVTIDVDVGIGRGKATVWTCDLTHGYISINADYRS